MRAHHKLQRLYLNDDLREGAAVTLDRDQSHYLSTVLRMAEGDSVLVFNGRDGEFVARLAAAGRKAVTLAVSDRTREQAPSPDLAYCFAPLKSARLDYMVQKAVEMGAGVLQPVVTQHTQNARTPVERMRANAIEAAEQCGALSVADVREAVKLERLIDDWDPERRLIFCDEAATGAPLDSLHALGPGKTGLIVGPEGGFSNDERARLLALPFVTAISLGPRILRADTAAVAALALVQSTIGDWRRSRSVE